MEKLQRILIVDGHPMLEAGVRALLAEEPGIEVLAQTNARGDASPGVGELTPQLLLLDRTVPGMDDAAAVAEIRRRYAYARVMLIVPRTTADLMLAKLLAGADGCIRQDAMRAEFRAAIHTVLQGKPYPETNVAATVLNNFAGRRPASTRKNHGPLTPRECDVLKLVAAGKSSKSIAEMLKLSVKTVGKHRANLMAKLDVHNAAGLTAYAIERGLLQLRE